MASTPRGGILTALAFGAAALGAAPATGFEIFGIHLWGPREPEEGFEVIDPLPYTVTLRVAGGENGLERRLQSRLRALERPRHPGVRHRRAPLQGARRLSPAARRALRRGLLRADDQHPRRRDRGRRGDARRRVPAASAGHDRRHRRSAVPVRRHRDRQRPARRGCHEDDETDTPESVGFVTGETARSGVINQASALSIERWRQLSYAKAREADREVIADHGTDRLDVRLALEPGRQARYGPVTVAGTQPDAPGLRRLDGRPARGAPLRLRRHRGRAGPAEPARRLPLAALRGGGDRARRQPADHHPGRGPAAAHHRRRRHLLDDRRLRRQRLLGAPQPLRPRRAAALLRERRRGRLGQPRRVQLRARRRLHPARGPDPRHQLRRRRLGVPARLRDLPPARRPGQPRLHPAVQPPPDRTADAPGLALALRGRPRHPRLHHRLGARRRRLRPPRRPVRRDPRLLRRGDGRAVPGVRVRQHRASAARSRAAAT